MSEQSPIKPIDTEQSFITLPHLKAMQAELKKYNFSWIDDLEKELIKGVEEGRFMYANKVNKTNIYNVLNGQVKTQLTMVCLYKAGMNVLEGYKEKAKKILDDLKVIVPAMSEEDQATYDALPKKKTRYSKKEIVKVKL